MSEEKFHMIVEKQDGSKVRVPFKNIRSQGGVKRDIVELVLVMPPPDRQCELTDFLGALQYVLDQHFGSTVKDLIKQVREIQKMVAELKIKIENQNEALEFAKGLINQRDPYGPEADVVDQVAAEGIENLDELGMHWYKKATRDPEEQ